MGHSNWLSHLVLALNWNRYTVIQSLNSSNVSLLFQFPNTLNSLWSKRMTIISTSRIISLRFSLIFEIERKNFIELYWNTWHEPIECSQILYCHLGIRIWCVKLKVWFVQRVHRMLEIALKRRKKRAHNDCRAKAEITMILCGHLVSHRWSCTSIELEEIILYNTANRTNKTKMGKKNRVQSRRPMWFWYATFEKAVLYRRSWCNTTTTKVDAY